VTPEMKRFVVEEVRRQLKIITTGAAGLTTMSTEDIQALLPGMPTIPARPIMHPFGFASRAPQGMISVTAQQGEHPGNKLTLGHRDKDAPSVDEGESVQYSKGGYRVVVKNGEIFVGKGTDLEHMVVGETLKAVLIPLITTINAHTHMGNLGFPTGKPLNAADFTAIQTNNLDNNKILAKDGGRY
jgi:hypothetical protein